MTRYSHGMARTPIYKLWKSLRARRKREGIEMFEDWAENFEDFYLWALDNGYPKKNELRRIDKSEGFTPWNAELIELDRKSISLEIDGVTKPLFEWVKETGISYRAAYVRFEKGLRGYDVIRTDTMRAPTYRVEYRGREWTMRELSEELGISRFVLSGRYKAGDRGERLVRPVQTKTKRGE